MGVFVDIVLVVLWLYIVILLALDIARYRLTPYSLSHLSAEDRRSPRGLIALSVDNIYRLQQIELALASIISLILLTWRRSWWLVFLIALVAVLLARLAAATRPARYLSDRYIKLVLPTYLYVIKYTKRFINYTVGMSVADGGFNSVDELLDIVAHNDALSKQQKRLIAHTLQFSDKSIRSILTLRANMNHIKSSDTLGPKLIDQLHHSGQSRFVVTGSSLDNIEGILYLGDVSDVSALQSNPKAKDLMRASIFYIHETATLGDALTAFLQTQSQTLFVINDKKHVLGLVNIEDLLEEMIGDKPTSDFTGYDEPSAVIIDRQEPVDESTE